MFLLFLDNGEIKMASTKTWALLAIVLVVIIVVGAVVYYVTLPVEPETEKTKVACLLPGSINDHGWNQAWFTALQVAETELGVETAYSEAVTVADAGGVFIDYAQRGFDLIWCLDFGMSDAAIAAAEDYPESTFAVPWYGVHGEPPKENIVGYVQGEGPTPGKGIQDASYLAGILAAGLTESGIIGVYGAMPAIPVVAFMEGFKIGAKTYAEENSMALKCLQQFVGAWEDVSAGYETTVSFIDAGADLIYCIGDGISFGGIMAAKAEGGVYVIGGAGDQRPIDPEIIVASIDYDIPKEMLIMTEAVMNGTAAEWGSTSKWVEVGGNFLIDWDEVSDIVSSDLRTRIEDAQEDLLDGTIEVPFITEITPPLDYTP